MKLDFIFSFAIAGLALAAAPSVAGVVLTEAQALERAFPEATALRRTLYLTKDEVKAVEAAAKSKLPSAVVTMFEAKTDGALVGRAFVDTHVVRTMPATVLVAVNPDGQLRAAIVLRFAEPEDYLPRERWLEGFRGKSLSDELWAGRGVPRVTGATLTVQALVDAVRRSLAIDEQVARVKP
jgi:Na+-translocating ferredoxin:NAD+ oxidoreductase subunit G